jgi:hypothetical protein
MSESPLTATDCSRVPADNSRKRRETRERAQPVAPPSTHVRVKILCQISVGSVNAACGGDLG